MDDSVRKLLSELTVSDVSEQKRVLSNLVDLVLELNTDDESDFGKIQEDIFKSVQMSLIVDILQGSITSKLEPVLTKSAQLVAELAKTEKLREPLVEKGLVPSFLNLISLDEMSLTTQSCRALGNICYDNDSGRLAVDKHNGVNVVVELLKGLYDSKAEGAGRLRCIVCGFLLNLTNNCEQLQERVIESGILNLLNDCLVKHEKDKDFLHIASLAISSITDSDSGKDAVSKSDLLRTIKAILDKDEWEDLTQTYLDQLLNLMESELCKDKGAELGLCESLIPIIDSDKHGANTTKLASDTFVSILVGDASMELMYEGGDGPVFKQCIQWLDSGDVNKKTLGCLTVGNFARKDLNCKHLAEIGVIQKLLAALKSTIGHNEDFALQHAALSALRNLAIPAENKIELLQAGAMDTCLCLVNTEHMAVVFKLLGVLRKLIEGQEAAAVQLGQQATFLERLAEWSEVEAHAGVKGEASRTIAALVKNSNSSLVVHGIIRSECLPHLVAMATSEHYVMVNEAIIALTIVCTTSLGEAAESLKEADLAGTVSKLLDDRLLPPEMLCNVFSLLKAIATSENLKEELLNSGVLDQLRNIASNHSDSNVKQASVSCAILLEQSLSTG